MTVSLGREAQALLKDAALKAAGRNERIWDTRDVLAAMARSRPGGDGHDVAGTLRRLGVDEERLLGKRNGAPRRGLQADEDISAAPELREVLIHTKWIAAYEHELEATTEHLLLGVLWSGETCAGRLLGAQGVDFDAVYSELRGRPVPPELRTTKPDEVHIPVRDLERVLARLPDLLPPGVTFAFNVNEEEAWLWTSHEIDLPDYVRRAREGREERPAAMKPPEPEPS